MGKKNRQKQREKRREQQEHAYTGITKFYHDKYKLLILIPLFILLLATIQIAVQVHTTGDFIQRGITLTGGVVITVTQPLDQDIFSVEQTLQEQFPDNELLVRAFTARGESAGVIVESDVESQEEQNALIAAISALYAQPPSSADISTESTGSTLGEDFFRQALWVVLIAYLFMAIMVFITFRRTVPSLLVVLAAVSNLVITLAVFNLLDMRLSSAGIAAFLMLIGYSVDTDILLTSRVIKHTHGTVFSRTLSAFKTGAMMSVSTVTAVTIVLLMSSSLIIQEIMIIILIGLLVDFVNTWLLNTGLLRWHLEGEMR